MKTAYITTPGIAIRRVEIDSDEIDDVRKLDRLTLPESVPSANTDWWGAYAGDELIAYAGARLLNSGAYFLSRAGVREPWRGLGLQRRLIRARVRHARAQGIARVVTYTMPHNAPSANSLIRCGFRVYAPETAWVGSGVIYWRLVPA